ncbi:hypothetical protein ACO0LK_19445 [Undibacterium sp. Ji49W]
MEAIKSMAAVVQALLMIAGDKGVPGVCSVGGGVAACTSSGTDVRVANDVGAS